MKGRANCGGRACRGGAKLERKEIERNRRLHMKGLCLKLSSLIPKEHYSSKDATTQLDNLDEAASYIMKLKKRMDELQQKKNLELSIKGISSGVTISPGLPVVEVRYHDTNLEVVLVSSLTKPFKFHEVITILEQEGAEVVNANFSGFGDKIFYTIHAQAFSSRIGLEASRVSERLKELIY